MSIRYFFYFLSKIVKKAHIPAVKNSLMNKDTAIGSSSLFVDSSIDRYSYIGNDCTVIYTKIGKFCSIANNVVIGGASHPLTWLSTSPVFHKGRNILKKNFSAIEYSPYKQTIIGNDVWIGDNTMIKSGVNISDGAIVGMGSIITKDVGCYEIWAGNPARCISRRFDAAITQKIQDTKWWELSDDTLSLLGDFDDIEKILKKLHLVEYDK